MENASETPSTSSKVPQSPVPIQQLREKIRVYSRSQREINRSRDCDALRFGLGEIRDRIEELENLTAKDVSGLAARIKRRKHATVEDMYRLSHAFLQDIENIRIFGKIPGAMQVLVKELTGNDAMRQIGAVECLCNFSLGEIQVCEKVANMAGSYLVTYLGSTEERLKRTSLWTVTNLLATGNKPAQTLIQMELVQKLWALYVADISEGAANTKDDFRKDAAIALQLITAHGRQLLRTEDLRFIKDNLENKNPKSIAGEYHLQLVFNCEIVNPMSTVNRSQLLYLINYALCNLCDTKDLNNCSDRLKIFYGVRILANILMCQPEAYDVLLRQVSTVCHLSLEAIFNKLFAFEETAVTQESLWLLRNVKELEERKESRTKVFTGTLKFTNRLTIEDFS